MRKIQPCQNKAVSTYKSQTEEKKSKKKSNIQHHVTLQ